MKKNAKTLVTALAVVMALLAISAPIHQIRLVIHRDLPLCGSYQLDDTWQSPTIRRITMKEAK